MEESGRFGGGGSIGESDESKHEASSEEKYFYKEVSEFLGRFL